MNPQKETERKWLVKIEKIPFDLSLYPQTKINQSYISFSPTIRLRSENDETYILCVKSKPKEGSLTRDEFEMNISKEQYDRLILKREGNIINKTRYFIPDGKYTMEIDVFSGALEGLCYLEIEFPSEEEALAYPNPVWTIKDVSCDHTYKNTSLAKSGMPF